MAPSVRPAARLSERPLLESSGRPATCAVGVRVRLCSAGWRWRYVALRRCRWPAPGFRCGSGGRRTRRRSASPEMRDASAATPVSIRPSHLRPSFRSGREWRAGRRLVAAAAAVAVRVWRLVVWTRSRTSDQARRPAELKHINKRRKSN